MDIREESLIISDILAGDPDAYAILVKRYQRPIFNLMIRMTSSEEDAFDLTQETFVRAYEKLDRFRLSSRFFPWLYTIGMNLARDFLRKRKIMGIGAEELYESQKNLSMEPGQENTLVEELDAQGVKAALQKLPLNYREAITLRFHEGMSMRDVAFALGISISGAKMRIHRGLLKLRQLIIRGESNAT
jgi:RNA polymerase sigma-70 factor (ECF subfamily)